MKDLRETAKGFVKRWTGWQAGQDRAALAGVRKSACWPSEPVVPLGEVAAVCEHVIDLLDAQEENEDMVGRTEKVNQQEAEDRAYAWYHELAACRQWLRELSTRGKRMTGSSKLRAPLQKQVARATRLLAEVEYRLNDSRLQIPDGAAPEEGDTNE